MDYNAEIPFQQLVPEGRHTVTDQETPYVDATISNDLLRKMEQKLAEEDDKRKKLLDKKRLQKIKQKNLPKLIEQQNQESRKLLQFSEMELPTPQISDQELISISKFTSNPVAMQDNPTSFLVGDYSTSRRQMLSSVRKTPLASEKLMREASYLHQLRVQPTPLQKGGDFTQDP